MRRADPIVRLVHPFPSAVNACLVLAIALTAGGTAPVAAGLALAMLLLQFCIGATNDVCDERLDAVTQPSKPLPAGLVSRRLAAVVAVACGATSLVGAAVVGAFDPVLVLVTAGMLGAGLAYDFGLKAAGLGWLCFALAFPLLPLYAWYGATGTLPPRSELLLPVAFLAGPALHLANSLVDVEHDRAQHLRTLAAMLGRGAGLAVLGVMLGVIHGLAWLTLPAAAPPLAAVVSLTAGALAVVGVGLLATQVRPARDTGWGLEALAIALLAGGWLLAA